MALKYYFDKMSQPSRAILMFLRANKTVIPFEEVPVALRKGELKCLVVGTKKLHNTSDQID